jgi:hypothetical protein
MERHLDLNVVAGSDTNTILARSTRMRAVFVPAMRRLPGRRVGRHSLRLPDKASL